MKRFFMQFLSLRNVWLLLAAGILGALGFHSYKAFKAHVAEAGPSVNVLFAHRSIHAGEAFRPGDLVARNIPEAYAHPHSILAAFEDQVLQQTCTLGVRKNEPLLWEHVGHHTPEGLSETVGVTQRAITLTLDDANSFHHQLQPLDRVDIMAILNPTVHHPEPVLQVLFQNVQVVAVDGCMLRRTQAGLSGLKGADSPLVRTVTFHLPAKEAATLAFVQTQGRIFLSLRNPKDVFHADIPPVSTSLLLRLLDETPADEPVVPESPKPQVSERLPEEAR